MIILIIFFQYDLYYLKIYCLINIENILLEDKWIIIFIIRFLIIIQNKIKNIILIFGKKYNNEFLYLKYLYFNLFTIYKIY